jgi:hypothetical protein
MKGGQVLGNNEQYLKSSLTLLDQTAHIVAASK